MGPQLIELSYNEEFVLPTYQCIDCESVTIDNPVVITTPGYYEVTFVAEDNNQNFATASVTVWVKKPAPHISLIGDQYYERKRSDEKNHLGVNIEDGATLSIYLNGTIELLNVGELVNHELLSTVGEYVVEYVATNDEGTQSKVTRNIKIINDGPRIELQGDVNSFTFVNEPMPELGVIYEEASILSITVDNELVDSEVAKLYSNLKLRELGTHTIVYTVEDMMGLSNSVTRYVEVKRLTSSMGEIVFSSNNVTFFFGDRIVLPECNLVVEGVTYPCQRSEVPLDMSIGGHSSTYSATLDKIVFTKEWNYTIVKEEGVDLTKKFPELYSEHINNYDYYTGINTTFEDYLLIEFEELEMIRTYPELYEQYLSRKEILENTPYAETLPRFHTYVHQLNATFDPIQGLQNFIDIVGLIPIGIIGEIADGVNAAIYWIKYSVNNEPYDQVMAAIHAIACGVGLALSSSTAVHIKQYLKASLSTSSTITKVMSKAFGYLDNIFQVIVGPLENVVKALSEYNGFFSGLAKKVAGYIDNALKWFDDLIEWYTVIRPVLSDNMADVSKNLFNETGEVITERLEVVIEKVVAKEYTEDQLIELAKELDGLIDDTSEAIIKDAIEGTSNLDNFLVDLIDDVGKVAADKFDDVVRKIDAGDFTDDELKRLVVETKDALTNNQKGILGETISDVTHKGKYPDFTELDCKLPKNNGFDGVYVKYGNDGSIEAVHIVEAKYGSSQLGIIKGVNGTGDIQQMSDDWVRDVITRMKATGDSALVDAANTLEDIMDDSPELITKYLDRIKKDTGDVVTTLLE